MARMEKDMFVFKHFRFRASYDDRDVLSCLKNFDLFLKRLGPQRILLRIDNLLADGLGRVFVRA